MTYRPDIDGLRAIAVVAVILCHISAYRFPGGFLGVDMFFVISGFLIGGIIYRQANAGVFSWKQFYLRRIRRILPAFFGVVICCLIVGTYIYVPDSGEWEKAKGTAIWSLPFMSNWFLSLRSSYFDGSARDIFNHLWSLAVEEQFYFVYPIILIALIKFTPPIFKSISQQERDWTLLASSRCCAVEFCYGGYLNTTYRRPILYATFEIWGTHHWCYLSDIGGTSSQPFRKEGEYELDCKC